MRATGLLLSVPRCAVPIGNVEPVRIFMLQGSMQTKTAAFLTTTDRSAAFQEDSGAESDLGRRLQKQVVGTGVSKR